MPWNPYEECAVLLVPAEFLRRLPTISPDDFWDYLWDNEGERLRDDFNYDVKTHVRKRDIVQIARANLFLVRDYISYVDARAKPTPYDLRDDPAGLYQWEKATSRYTQAHPLSFEHPRTQESFVALITSMANEFQHFVEREGGYKLLWNDKPRTPKSEEAAQLLFAGIVKHYCRANNIDISREVETGGGPVDFKFSEGYQFRALLEVKLATNGRFWQGIERQVPQYLRAAQAPCGFYLIVVHNKADKRKLSKLEALTKSLAERIGVQLEAVIVDATRPKLSASRL